MINAHEYSSKANAIRAAKLACKKALGKSYEAYEGPDFFIHPSARPVWDTQGWRYELRGPALDASK